MASKKPRRDNPAAQQSAPERRSPDEVIAGAADMLENARRGLAGIRDGAPADFNPGLHNVIVFGRSVTIALQRLRSIVPGFDEWYESRIPANDPLLRYMNAARNAILKEASAPRPTMEIHFEGLEIGPDGSTNVFAEDEPVGAIGFFIGEMPRGGSGWHVQEPDGSLSTFYSRLRSDASTTMTMHLPDPPASFMGEPLTDTTVVGIATSYVDWLDGLVKEAAEQFSR